MTRNLGGSGLGGFWEGGKGTRDPLLMRKGETRKHRFLKRRVDELEKREREKDDKKERLDRVRDEKRKDKTDKERERERWGGDVEKDEKSNAK